MSLKNLCILHLALQCLVSSISCNSALLIINQKEEAHLQSGNINSQDPPPTDPPQAPSDSTKKTYQRTLPPVLTFGQQEVQPTLFEQLTKLPSLPPAADSFTLQLPPTDTQGSAPAGVCMCQLISIFKSPGFG